MPNYAIMRCKKLVGMGSVAASLQHCYRERDTPNADHDRTPENVDLGAGSTDEAMGKMRALLPDKRRKDAVLAVEYVMTASPEWWREATSQQQADFMMRSKKWLADKYGADRIITATVHNDEATPHLSAFVVPLTQDGRLSAKEFVGDRGKMQRDQTSFAEAVRDLGLTRGAEGSRTTHQRVKSFYGAISEPERTVEITEDELKPRKMPALTLVQRIVGAEETEAAVVRRLNAKIQAAVAPTAARAATATADRDRASRAEIRAQQAENRERQERERREKLEKIMKPFIELGSLSKEVFAELAKRVHTEVVPGLKKQIEQKKAEIAQTRKSKGLSR